MLDYRRGVAAEKELPVADAYRQRRRFPGRHNHVGAFHVDHCDGIRPDHLAQGQTHGLLKATPVLGLHISDEHGEHLRVGLAVEEASPLAQGFLQDAVILYRAVVNDGYPARVVELRMRVDVAGLAMGGPARMGYAHAACRVFVVAIKLEFADAPLGRLSPFINIGNAWRAPIYPTIPHTFSLYFIPTVPESGA